MPGVVAVSFHAALADLQQKFSILGAFQNLSVAIAVPGQPDVVVGVDGDAVLTAAGPSVAVQTPVLRAGLAFHMRRMQSAAVKPLVSALFGRSAPALDVAASRAELQDRWS